MDANDRNSIHKVVTAMFDLVRFDDISRSKVQYNERKNIMKMLKYDFRC